LAETDRCEHTRHSIISSSLKRHCASKSL
jgi:hypothetical protein